MDISELRGIVAVLDAEIDAAEQTLHDLRRKREGAEVFMEYASRARSDAEVSAANRTAASPAPDIVTPFLENRARAEMRLSNGAGPTAVVETIIRENNLYDFHTKQIIALAAERGANLSPTQVSNGLTYLRRLKFIEPGVRKSRWVRAASGTVLSGATTEDSDAADATSGQAADSESAANDHAVGGTAGAP